MNNTLLSKLLLLLKVKHTESLDKLYFEHPYKYTFYGLERMLSLYNIETNTLILKNKDEFEKLDTPFLAEVNNDIAIVENISHDMLKKTTRHKTFTKCFGKISNYQY